MRRIVLPVLPWCGETGARPYVPGTGINVDYGGPRGAYMPPYYRVCGTDMQHGQLSR